MRIDMPLCNFKNCRYSFDGNCTAGEGRREGCDYLVINRELSSYRQAEEQGLLVKLPCKVGDTVYMLYSVFDVATGITREDIEQGTVSELRGNKFNPIWYLVDCKTHRRDFHPSQIGKSVFFTRESAEKALKGVVSDVN